MNGLDLESFLYLLRADLAAWFTLAVIVVLLALMSWTSWGSRRALRKCLILSIAAHLGFVIFGGSYTLRVLAIRPTEDEGSKPRIRAISILPRLEGPETAGYTSPDGKSGRRVAAWDRPGAALAVADPKLRPRASDVVDPEPIQRSESPKAVEMAKAAPESPLPNPERPAPPRIEKDPEDQSTPPRVTPVDPTEIREVQALDDDPAAPGEKRPPERVAGSPDGEPEGNLAPTPVNLPRTNVPGTKPPLPETSVGSPARPSNVSTDAMLPNVDIRRRMLAGNGRLDRSSMANASTDRSHPAAPLTLARTAPSGRAGLSDLPVATGRRSLTAVPEVYRPRLSPNRSAEAKRSGASNASEQAVERALDWLSRHQDTDGRWDGGTEKNSDGLPAKGEHNFTIHCPAGEICFGECFYHSADTAMTGLALLAYLGAGYTHTEGKYTQTIGKGLQFLLGSQKADGDLANAGENVVAMYCHAMATLALSEAYALSRDESLREPVARAVRFLVDARARDGMSWRYKPSAPFGDTSVLGWAVLVLKSAREVGIDVPDSARKGATSWLSRVASGAKGGLAMYIPGGYPDREAGRITPSMTAEAWVCRQFLGLGGPGPASKEAADFLLENGPKPESLNLYYWYYGTLAMYQHGGETWTQWNLRVRDELVQRQRFSGHGAGSWDPETDKYGSKGGRIYSTALAALTLEVYYRYLRLYDAPAQPAIAPAPERPADTDVRRARGR
jgi:hypothetical protein